MQLKEANIRDMYTQCRNDFITIRNAERNQLVYMLQKYHKTTHVRRGGNYLYWAYVYA